ncbi:MAG: hypothetical protein ACMUIP_01850 [bacterium]
MKHYKSTVLIFLIVIGLVFPAITSAQNWIELPPYNTLWPLWSPTLSPVSDTTGLPTPIINSLAPSTVLPVMPGLTWDPSMPYPWLLYNTFSGLAYFDPLAGINLWPAPSLIDNAGLPSPLSLPLGFADLPPTDASWLSNNVFPANNSYVLSYQSFLPTLAGPVWLVNPPLLSDLLTPLDILGPSLGVPSALAPPPAPLPLTPIPTAVAAPVIAEQAGVWSGKWYEAVGFLFGEMTMVLIDAPTPGTLTGTVTLLGNLYVPLPISITGSTIGGAAVELSGLDPTGSYQLILNGILTSATTMNGTWMVIDLKTGLLAKDGSGTFDISLINPLLAAPTTTVAPAIIAPTLTAPTAAISQIVPLAPFALAEQVGTWQGLWTTGLTSGPMYLNLGEVIDPLTGAVTLQGYTQLLGNPWLGTLIDNLDGTVLNNQIYVTGSGIGAGNTNYTIEIVGTLTSTTTMTGVYTLIGTANSIKEVGSFDLDLLPPIL